MQLEPYPEWPVDADGQPLTIGEMPPEKANAILAVAARRYRQKVAAGHGQLTVKLDVALRKLERGEGLAGA